jgi:hypothetical protein
MNALSCVYTYNFIILPTLLFLYCWNLFLIIIITIIIQRFVVYPDPSKYSALFLITIFIKLHYFSYQYKPFCTLFVLLNVLWYSLINFFIGYIHHGCFHRWFVFSGNPNCPSSSPIVRLTNVIIVIAISIVIVLRMATSLNLLHKNISDSNTILSIFSYIYFDVSHKYLRNSRNLKLATFPTSVEVKNEWSYTFISPHGLQWK